MPRTPRQIADLSLEMDPPDPSTMGASYARERAQQAAKLMLQDIREELQHLVNGWSETDGHITEVTVGFVKKLQDPHLKRIDFTDINPGMRIRGVTADGTHIEGNVRELRDGVAWLGHPPAGQRGFALGPKTPELYEVTLP